MKSSMRRIAQIAALVALAAAVTGCCFAPFGWGHGERHGYYQGSGGR